MQIDDTDTTARMRVTVSHRDRHRLVQAEHVLELGRIEKRLEKRNLRGAGIAEHVPDALAAKRLQHEVAAARSHAPSLGQRLRTRLAPGWHDDGHSRQWRNGRERHTGFKVKTVTCPSGKVATGGGYYLTGFVQPAMQITRNQPFADWGPSMDPTGRTPIGWRVDVYREGSAPANYAEWGLGVFVICS